jgi:hypothetical protein
MINTMEIFQIFKEIPITEMQIKISRINRNHNHRIEFLNQIQKDHFFLKNLRNSSKKYKKLESSIN